MTYFTTPLSWVQIISDIPVVQESGERKSKLDLYRRLRSEGCCARTALDAIKTSRSTYYRWKKNYKRYGIEGLENHDRTPRDKRKPTWDKETENLVAQVRKKYYLWGKAKIAVILKREHGVCLSESMVSRILTHLIERGIVKTVAYHLGETRVKKKRVFSGHARRWEYGMKSKKPGELIQVDHATIRLISGATIKHFAAICPFTKYVVEQAYTSASSFIGEDFLEYMIKKFPFEIKSIQVDGGCEFMGAFERLCEIKALDLFVLPPRRPQYNGAVERSHGTVKREFYYHYCGSNNLTVLRGELQKHVDFYNDFRPHQHLNYKTPLAYYNQLGATV